MDVIFRDYWPQLVFAILTVFGFGKGWQTISVMCKTLEEHSDALKETRENQGFLCTHTECEKTRESCMTRNEKQFIELKGMLLAMDNRREVARDDVQTILTDIFCRMGRLEGKIEGKNI